jgi:hypothetical protein
VSDPIANRLVVPVHLLIALNEHLERCLLATVNCDDAGLQDSVQMVTQDVALVRDSIKPTSIMLTAEHEQLAVTVKSASTKLGDLIERVVAGRRARLQYIRLQTAGQYGS